jgi:[ribosomal protein S5]-alanine N-acetyltransferase
VSGRGQHPGRGTITPMSRVAIRTPTAADEGEFIAAMRASRSLHRPWLYMPGTPERYAAYLARVDDPRAAPYLACRLEDGAIVGFVNVSEIVAAAATARRSSWRSAAASSWRGSLPAT